MRRRVAPFLFRFTEISHGLLKTVVRMSQQHSIGSKQGCTWRPGSYSYTLPPKLKEPKPYMMKEGDSTVTPAAAVIQVRLNPCQQHVVRRSQGEGEPELFTASAVGAGGASCEGGTTRNSYNGGQEAAGGRCRLVRSFRAQLGTGTRHPGPESAFIGNEYETGTCRSNDKWKKLSFYGARENAGVSPQILSKAVRRPWGIEDSVAISPRHHDRHHFLNLCVTGWTSEVEQ